MNNELTSRYTIRSDQEEMFIVVQNLIDSDSIYKEYIRTTLEHLNDLDITKRFFDQNNNIQYNIVLLDIISFFDYLKTIKENNESLTDTLGISDDEYRSLENYIEQIRSVVNVDDEYESDMIFNDQYDRSKIYRDQIRSLFDLVKHSDITEICNDQIETSRISSALFEYLSINVEYFTTFEMFEKHLQS